MSCIKQVVSCSDCAIAIFWKLTRHDLNRKEKGQKNGNKEHQQNHVIIWKSTSMCHHLRVANHHLLIIVHASSFMHHCPCVVAHALSPMHHYLHDISCESSSENHHLCVIVHMSSSVHHRMYIIMCVSSSTHDYLAPLSANHLVLLMQQLVWVCRMRNHRHWSCFYCGLLF